MNRKEYIKNWKLENKDKVKGYRQKYEKKSRKELNIYMRNWRKNNPEKAHKIDRRSRIKSKYNLTLEQHKEMYIQQNGCCIICNESVPYDKMSTDHDHKTEKVRRLTCQRCNTIIGFIENYPELVPIIQKYLLYHSV